MLPAWVVLLCLAAAIFSVAAAQAAQSAPALLSLWSPEQLAGGEADRVIGPVVEPDASLPQLDPSVALPDRPGRTPSALRGIIHRVDLPAGRRAVALSFDLCERANNVAGYENRIVGLLRAADAHATFFAGGKWMRSHPERAMQLMADPRFEIGSHTWTHGNLALMTPEEIATQMRLTEIEYANLRAELARRAAAAGLGRRMARVPQVLRLMRLPYGRSSETALEELAGAGYVVIQWDVEGEQDEERHSPAELARIALARIRPGSIVLMHANAVPEKTYELVRRLVPALRKRGYELVTVGELLRLGRARTAREGCFTTPGDNLVYDGVFPGKGTLKPDPARPFTATPVP
jgi:peptidoglycan/xylan/chitin deacetylase (PgdA/CDA1 family)